MILRKFPLRLTSRIKHIVCRFSTSVSSEIDPDSFAFDEIPIKNIRNFSIIAHVDHGKSTLADRLLEVTGTVAKNSGAQILDSLQIEKDRGITVKAQSVSLLYKYANEHFLMNLIDTPGHVDFSNEVSRSLAACDGVVLLVDANSGVQAQTVANYYLAHGKNLTIIPVLNKIDLKNADPDRVCQELKSIFDIDPDSVLRVSAKLGTNVEQVLQAIIERIAPPTVDREAPLRALLFDSFYDRYRGTMNLFYLKDGHLELGQEIKSCHTGKVYEVKSLSLMRVSEVPVARLTAGQIGLVGANMRNSKDSNIGDTFTLKNSPPVAPLPGFKPNQPMVFAGIYPADQSQHKDLRSAIEKLILTDSCVTLVPDSSPALGQGWRLGFLGLLHLEVFSQRLEQEYGQFPIITSPNVTYKLKLKGTKVIREHGKDTIFISNPALLPDPVHVAEYYEPVVVGTIITPISYVGAIISLCMDRRGVELSSTTLDSGRVLLSYRLPLNEIIVDFHDTLKSITSGFASFDYEEPQYEQTHLLKLVVMLNGQPVEELSQIVHFKKVERVARALVLRLKDEIPRQMVQVAIQACVGGKVIARETIKAFRKDVTAKLYGGDVTRRMKLLKQQAEGKKKMRSIANIQVPRETFINVLKKE